MAGRIKGCAVVTGAFGGNGAVFARSLAARGHRVLAIARASDALTRVADELRRTGAVIEAMAVDLSSTEGVTAASDQAQALGDVELPRQQRRALDFGRFLEQSAEKELQSIWGARGFAFRKAERRRVSRLRSPIRARSFSTAPATSCRRTQAKRSPPRSAASA